MEAIKKAALSLLLVAASATLGACKEEAEKPEPAASGSIEAKPGVTVSDARLVLNAVAGNPAVAYFVIDNKSKEKVAISALSIKGAGRVEIHAMEGGEMKMVEGVEAAPGLQIRLEPGATHAMVFDLGQELTAGAETEFTLTFTDGDKITFPVRIQSAAEAAALEDEADSAMEHEH